MSDATIRSPAQQSASQLSENIGDVLASIRRLIAQDEAADAVTAPTPVPSWLMADPRDGDEGALRTSFAESVNRRRDILAEAQALTRRSEAAFGQTPEAAAPLTLDAAARVTSSHRATPSRGEAVTGGLVGPLVLTAPLGETEAPVTEGSDSVIAAPILDGTPMSPLVVAASAEPREAAVPPVLSLSDFVTTMPAVECVPAAIIEHPASRTAQSETEAMNASDEPTSVNPALLLRAGTNSDPAFALTGSPKVAVAATGAAAALAPVALQAAVATATAEAATTSTAPAPAAPPPVEQAAVPAVAPAQAAVVPTPTPIAAPPPEDEDGNEDDTTASILREMIREVVRQELTGDSAGRMTGDLRTMIMREVAQALTQGVRKAR